MSLADQLKRDQQSEHANKGGGWFKFKEGENKLRVLVSPEAIYEDFKLGICYTNCGFKGSIKYLSRVYDYSDDSVKLMKIPFGIMEYISGLESNEDYRFTGFPMPYDIIVKAEGAGTKEVTYTVTPRPKHTPVPESVTAELHKMTPVPEVIKGLKEKNEDKHKADGTWQKLQDEMALAEADRKAAAPTASN